MQKRYEIILQVQRSEQSIKMYFQLWQSERQMDDVSENEVHWRLFRKYSSMQLLSMCWFLFFLPSQTHLDKCLNFCMLNSECWFDFFGSTLQCRYANEISIEYWHVSPFQNSECIVTASTAGGCLIKKMVNAIGMLRFCREKK